MSDPVSEFEQTADHFAAIADAVPAGRWDAPAPVEGWVARDVVRHLVEWFPAFLASGAQVHLAPGPDVDADPAGAWRHLAEQVLTLLEDPASEGKVLSNPHIGDVPLAQAVAQFFTADVFMHTWDLARATGQDPALDPDRCAQMLAGMEPLDDMLRASGQYGAKVVAPDGADPQARLMAFIGRDPDWSPPAT